MNDLIEQTVALVQKSSELINQTGTNEIVKTAAKGFFNWLGNIFSKNSAKEKLKLIEENKANQETIAGLKANLECILESNDELCKQLENKKNELFELYKNNGVSLIITGNNNNILKDVINYGTLTIK